MEKTVVLLMKEFESEKLYWQKKLSGGLTEIKIIPDASPKSGHELKNHLFNLNDTLTQKIFYISKNNDLSLYIILLAAFKVLLFWYTSEKDIIVSSPMHVKDEIDYNEFIILRDFIDKNMTFLELLMAVKNTVVEAYQNQHYPMDKILEGLDHTYSKDSFTRIIMLIDSVHKKESIQPIIQAASYDFTLSFEKLQGVLGGKIGYNGKLFSQSTVKSILLHYELVLEWVIANMQEKLKEMELISEEEKQRILNDFNNTSAQYPADKTLHELFSKQVSRIPDNIILVGERLRDRGLPLQQMTFRQLDEESNKLAHKLRGIGINSGTIAAIMIRPSIETIICILGILKTGAPYLPIELNSPIGRISHILIDSGAKVLLNDNTFESAPPQLPGMEKEVLSLANEDNLKQHKMGDKPIALNLEQENWSLECDSDINYSISECSPTDLAYVIYTSGTTGRPKGVLIEHRGVVNYAYWRIKTYAITEKDVTLQLLSSAFDGFNSNLYSSLISGSPLIMVPGEKILDFNYIKKVIQQKGVTNTSLVPRIYQLLIDSADADHLKSLRFIVLAGEKPDNQLIHKSQLKNSTLKHIMEYGPTEASVTATANMKLHPTNATVIGNPISNVCVYIIDPANCLQSVGIAGELLITGVGLARGYLNLPELTEDKFFIPMRTQKDTKKLYPYSPVYRTGDLARWLPDGSIELLGRIDNQVKVRGFRIELEEIEKQLNSHNGIISAAVILLKEKENLNICAYFVADKKIKIPELRENLAKVLPNYMIPSYFHQLERLALTISGKVNRKELAAMAHKVDTGIEYVAPQNEKEKIIAQIWKEVLGLEKVGINDNFFNIGGNSLNLVILNRKLNASLGVEIPSAIFFEYTTINSFIQYLAERETGENHSFKPVEKSISVTDVRESRKRRQERRR